jgi:hypothetical protein
MKPQGVPKSSATHDNADSDAPISPKSEDCHTPEAQSEQSKRDEMRVKRQAQTTVEETSGPAGTSTLERNPPWEEEGPFMAT